jgi:hypothetical protein
LKARVKLVGLECRRNFPDCVVCLQQCFAFAMTGLFSRIDISFS